MCGRFLASKSADEIARWFATRNATPNSRPRYNVAPTQDVLAVRFNPETSERNLDGLRWGLVPFWAKDIKIGYSLINAKAETVAEKPAFRARAPALPAVSCLPTPWRPEPICSITARPVARLHTVAVFRRPAGPGRGATP